MLHDVIVVLFSRPLTINFMDYTPIKKNYKYRFDFDIGYLVKSPCRGCDIRDRFPNCMKKCGILNRIHEVLSFGVSCSKNVP